MITGFNTDIEHDGVVYHVQTEDKGLASPLILSLVYAGGAILASKRSPYQDLIAAGFDEEVLSQRLKKQHRLICAAITAGRIDELKRMGARVASEDKAIPVSEEKAIPTGSVVPEVYEPIALETSSERPTVAEEPSDAASVEGPSLNPTILPQPTDVSEPAVGAEPKTVSEQPVSSSSPDEETLARAQRRLRAQESAYTVYDPRRKASPVRASRR